MKKFIKCFQVIQSSKYDYVLTFDADGEHDVRDLKSSFYILKNFNLI